MADRYERTEGDDPTDRLDVDDIKRKADYVRDKILSGAKIERSSISPNVFNYKMDTDSAGLNEISSVYMGYADTSMDFHSEYKSKRAPYLMELENHVKLMENSDNAFVVINGDLFSYIPKTKSDFLLSYDKQVAYFYSLLKNLAKQGKIAALVRGTEEHRILQNHGQDLLSVLQEALGLTNKVCNDALMNVNIKDDIVGSANVAIRTINWNNTVATGAYFGRKMLERATQRAGADIYLARSPLVYYHTAIIGESNAPDNVAKKPIYLISGGPYTPFKGAMTAGAEYNSVKDGELAPNSFWYKITIDENPRARLGEKPYVIRVNPVQYAYEQINQHGTDVLTAVIQNQVQDTSNELVKYFMDKVKEKSATPRMEETDTIRQVLLKNREVAEQNAQFEKYRLMKSGLISASSVEKTQFIHDLGSNVPESTPKIMIDGEDENFFEME